PTNAGMLVATERCLDEKVSRAAVNGHTAGTQLHRHAEGGRTVSGHHRTAQAELRLVGQADSLFIAIKADDDADRAEDLLLSQDRGVVDVVEQRRLVEEAPREVRRTLAAADQGG